MIGIILVSHSSKIVEGLYDMIKEMVNIDSDNEQLSLQVAGGTEDGRLGTSAITIFDKIEECSNCSDIFIFCDMGSAFLSAEMAQEMCDPVTEKKVRIVNVPLIDGAFFASVQASIGKNAEEIMGDLATEFSFVKE